MTSTIQASVEGFQGRVAKSFTELTRQAKMVHPGFRGLHWARTVVPAERYSEIADAAIREEFAQLSEDPAGAIAMLTEFGRNRLEWILLHSIRDRVVNAIKREVRLVG